MIDGYELPKNFNNAELLAFLRSRLPMDLDVASVASDIEIYWKKLRLFGVITFLFSQIVEEHIITFDAEALWSMVEHIPEVHGDWFVTDDILDSFFKSAVPFYREQLGKRFDSLAAVLLELLEHFSQSIATGLTLLESQKTKATLVAEIMASARASKPMVIEIETAACPGEVEDKRNPGMFWGLSEVPERLKYSFSPPESEKYLTILQRECKEYADTLLFIRSMVSIVEKYPWIEILPIRKVDLTLDRTGYSYRKWRYKYRGFFVTYTFRTFFAIKALAVYQDIKENITVDTWCLLINSVIHSLTDINQLDLLTIEFAATVETQIAGQGDNGSIYNTIVFSANSEQLIVSKSKSGEDPPPAASETGGPSVSSVGGGGAAAGAARRPATRA